MLPGGRLPAVQTIGVLTSGGDAPGMNAAIRAVVRRGMSTGSRVVGVQRGFAGLVAGDFVPFRERDAGNIIHRGGTILHAGRFAEFTRLDMQRQALHQLAEAGVDALVVIGGDGSFRGGQALAALGLPCVAIPATIDNDVCGTDFAIGFDTALNTVVEAMNRIRDTAESHDRVFVLEVMGRQSGWIALLAGLAGGAESVLIPEAPPDLDAVCGRLERSMRLGKRYSLIVVAEGAGSGFAVAEAIQQRTGYDTRVTVLGHVQRGGAPTAFDRVLASRLGALAVDSLHDGSGRGKAVGFAQGRLNLTDLTAATAQRKPIPRDLIALTEDLAI